MFAFFDILLTFVVTIVNFIVNFFRLLITVVMNVVRAVSWLFLCLGYLPPWLMAFVVVPIALAVIFQIINKGD